MATCSKCGVDMGSASAFLNCEGCRKEVSTATEVEMETATEVEMETATEVEMETATEVGESSGSEKKCRRCKRMRDSSSFKENAREFGNCLECRTKDRLRRAKKRVGGQDEYLKHNADLMKKWRLRNPEKWAANQEKAKRGNNIRAIKQQAERKGIAWEITMEHGLELSYQPCFYCGGFAPSGINGIDRLDNAKGYTLENVKPCCNACNMSKGTLDPESFLGACEAIHAYVTGTKAESRTGNGLSERQGADYGSYVERALKKNAAFALSKRAFEEIQMRPCYLCGKTGALNGVDRKDNTKGYTPDNSFPCCGECNYLKRDHAYESFVNMVAKIANNAEVVRGLLPSGIQPNRSSRTHMRFEKLKGNALKEHLKRRREAKLEIHQVTM